MEGKVDNEDISDCMWQNRPILDNYSLENLLSDAGGGNIYGIERIYPEQGLKFVKWRSVIYKFTVRRSAEGGIKNYPMMIKFLIRRLPSENDLAQDFSIQNAVYSSNRQESEIMPLCPKPYFYSMVEPEHRNVLVPMFFSEFLSTDEMAVKRRFDLIFGSGILVTQFLDGFTTLETVMMRKHNDEWNRVVQNLARLQLLCLLLLGYTHNDAHTNNFMIDKSCFDRIFNIAKAKQSTNLHQITVPSVSHMLDQNDSMRRQLSLFENLPRREGEREHEEEKGSDDERNFEVFHNLICVDTLNALILIDFGFCKKLNEEDKKTIKQLIQTETAWRDGERVTNFLPIIPNLLAIIQKSHQASWDARAEETLSGHQSSAQQQRDIAQQHMLFGWINTNSLREKQILSSCLSYYLRQQGDGGQVRMGVFDGDLRKHTSTDVESTVDGSDGVGVGTLDLSKIRGGRSKKKKKTRKRRPRRTRKKKRGKRKYFKGSRRKN